MNKDYLDLICTYCQKNNFSRVAHYESHLRTHTGERPFPCRHINCGKSFTRKDHLVKHTFFHTGEKPFKCQNNSCKQCFATKSQLTRHIKLIHDAPTPYSCDLCTLSFNKKSKLRNHRVAIHNVPYFACSHDGCQRLFPCNSKLIKHELTHKLRYICHAPGCEFIMASSSDLRKHILQEHPESMPHRRKRKNGDNDDVEDIEDHLEKENNFDSDSDDSDDSDDDESVKKKLNKQFVCTYGNCSRSFTENKNLKAHIRATHGESKPFLCTEEGCMQRFGFKSVLIKHVQKIHKNGKKKRVVQMPYNTGQQDDILNINDENIVWNTLLGDLDALDDPQYICLPSNNSIEIIDNSIKINKQLKSVQEILTSDSENYDEE